MSLISNNSATFEFWREKFLAGNLNFRGELKYYNQGPEREPLKVTYQVATRNPQVLESDILVMELTPSRLK